MANKDGTVATNQELVQQGLAAHDTWVHAEDKAVTPDPAQAAPPAPVAETPVAAVPTEPAAAPVAPAPGASAAAVQEFIDALVGDDDDAPVHRIPALARIPLEVNGRIVYKPIAQLRSEGMLHEDYSAKTRETADARRELEGHAQRLIADQARVQAREQWLKEEATRLREAQKSPEAWERYQQHLARMEEDPQYRETFELALEAREGRAESAASEAADHQQAVQFGVTEAADLINRVANEREFASLPLDLDRVREVVASEISAGRAIIQRNKDDYVAALLGGEPTIDPAAVRAIIAREAQLTSRSDPSQDGRITALQAQVDALTQRLADTASATAHNAATSHAVQRDKAVPVATGVPAAPIPADRKVKPFAPRDLPDVNSAWAARRD